MTQLQAELEALVKSHPTPEDVKFVKQIERLERLIRFYKEKAPLAPEKQGWLFNGFTHALIYAITMIRMYRKLTKKLAELAEKEKI